MDGSASLNCYYYYYYFEVGQRLVDAEQVLLLHRPVDYVPMAVDSGYSECFGRFERYWRLVDIDFREIACYYLQLDSYFEYFLGIDYYCFLVDNYLSCFGFGWLSLCFDRRLVDSVYPPPDGSGNWAVW